MYFVIRCDSWYYPPKSFFFIFESIDFLLNKAVYFFYKLIDALFIVYGKILKYLYLETIRFEDILSFYRYDKDFIDIKISYFIL